MSEETNKSRPAGDTAKEAAETAPAVVPEEAAPASEEQATERGEEAPPRRRGRAALVLALLCLVLILALGGAAGWLGWRQHLQLQQAGEQRDELRGLLGEKADRDELARSVQGSGRNLQQLQQRLEALAGENTGLRERLQQVELAVHRNQRGWTLAEALYLLRMAEYRLVLVQDRRGAVAALESADAALHRLGEADLLPVREALAAEIAALKRLPRPDVEGVVLALGELQKDIDRLPLVGQPGSAPAQAAETLSGGIWDQVQRFVVIKHQSRPISGRPEPAAQARIRTRLHTALAEARLAALRLDQEAFVEAMASAERLVKSEFEPDAEAVGEFLNRLEAQHQRILVGKPPSMGAARRLLADLVAVEPGQFGDGR